MTKSEHKKFDLGHFFRSVFSNVVVPVLDDSANKLSDGESRMMMPTGPQSTSYYTVHPHRRRC
jgi:hypothetical protein